MPRQKKAKSSPKEATRTNKKKEDPEPSAGKSGVTYRDPDAPPNDHIQRDPDEVYGDTSIPDRNVK
jgi:hypothetical protein